MSARKRERGSNRLISFLVMAGGLIGIGSLLYIKPPASGSKLSNTSPNSAIHASQVLATGPRRLPVAGIEGVYVVINPDGTSYLETPQGQQGLVTEDDVKQPSPADLAERIAARLKKNEEPEKPREPGQLVVLDEGVVDVPKNAIITLVAKDRLVVLNSDGTSTVYRADGSVEQRQSRGPVERRKP